MTGQRVTLVAVGDLAFDHGVSEIIERNGPDFPFLNIASELKEADIVFGNLETPLTTCQKNVVWDFSKLGLKGRTKQFFLKGSPLAAVGLKNAGFNVVSIANNHILDYGMRGLNDTVTVLNENGIVPVGFGRNTREATAPRLLKVKGVRFAFFASSFAYEATFFSPGVAPIGLRTLKKQLRKAREISDIKVVSLHLGKEFEESPSTLTVRFARNLVKIGADVVLCHHPHTLQKIEAYKKGLIAYSLGNFVFDYHSFLKYTTEENAEKSRRSVILKCAMSEQGLIDYSAIPVELNDEFQPTMISRNSKLGDSIITKVQAPLLPCGLPSSKNESALARKEVAKALNGLAVNLGRKDFKSLYILLRKSLDRVYEHAATW